MKGGWPLKNEQQSLTSEQDDSSTHAELTRSKKTWEPMKLSYTGEAKDVVQGGGGKLSNAPADPGEPRKTPPSG
jgi:hypothetical protein